MPDAPRDQLAAVAKVAGDLDELLDKLFANVAELKAILAAEARPGDAAGGSGERP